MTIDVAKLRELLAERELTQVELAERSNVSRATLAKLLNGRASSVHRGTAEKLGAALGVRTEVLDAHGVETAYLRAVAEEHEFLDFTGLGLVSTANPMPLDRGFVPLTVRRRQREQHQRGDCEGRLKSEPRIERPQGFPLEAALARSHRFFLLGEPGSGKTTSLRHFASAAAKARGSDKSEPSSKPIPIFVRLADWSHQLADDENVDLIHAAVGQLPLADRAAAAGWLEEEAREDNLLLLLDGLDEVADPELQALLIEQIRGFVRSHPDADVIVTSRPIGFERPSLGAGFEVLSIERLGVEAVRSFCMEWSAFRDGHDSGRECPRCEERVEQYRHAIVDNPRIQTLAGNPMMLTILCLLHEAGAALPQKRYQLYEKIVEAFLFSWEQRKRTALSGAPDRRVTLDEREAKWLLESVALEMQRNDRTLVPRWWLLDRSVSFLRDELGLESDNARAAAEALLWSLHQRAGVLVERGPERFGFCHLAFQEHFAARAILAEEDPLEALQPYLYHPRWREVVRLAAAQLDRRRAPKLLRMILDDPDPTGRFLKRGLLTALGCLADGAPVHESTPLDVIRRSIVELGKSKWLGITRNVLEVIAELRGTRLDDLARRTVTELLESARENASTRAQALLVVDAFMAGFVDGPDDPHEKADSSVSCPIVELKDGDGGVGLTLTIRPEPPDAHWVEKVARQLKANASPAIRATSARELGVAARARKSVRDRLLRALKSEDIPSVRTSIVDALESVARKPAIRRALIRVLGDATEDDDVRGACARSLRTVAAVDTRVRADLISYLDADVSGRIRAGAISGLAECVVDAAGVRDVLSRLLLNVDTDEALTVACLHSLDAVFPSLPDGISMLVAHLSHPHGERVRHVAAQILAEYGATGRVRWEVLPIERIEQTLVSLKRPCSHALDALRALVDAREVRRLGIPREGRIARALSAYQDSIRMVFIFGSAARGEQGPDSDLDLMIIGDVTLKELTPGLKRLEQELARQVNVVLYDQAEWDRRRAEGDPFVTEVHNGKKVFVKGGPNDLRAVVR